MRPKTLHFYRLRVTCYQVSITEFNLRYLGADIICSLYLSLIAVSTWGLDILAIVQNIHLILNITFSKYSIHAQ